MAARKLLLILLLIAAGFSLTGCFQVNREFRKIRNQAFTGIPGDFSKDTEFALGPFSMSVLRKVVDFSGESDEDAREIIKYVSEVQIGVYKKNELTDSKADYDVISSISANMEKKGWKQIIRSYSGHEVSIILIRTDNDKSLTDMFIVALDRKELVLTNLHGKLDKIFQYAVKERGIKFHRHS